MRFKAININLAYMHSFLPITQKEIKDRQWDYVDIIIVSGDAYVDHPSFGHAVIGRTLEQAGYRVAILPQPNWRDDLRDFKKFGKPRLFFGVTSGCMDSMVNHYTAAKRLRSNDAYTPGGEAGFRPDFAVSVYSNILKELYPDTPVIIGGIEASMRRLAHYDYWSDSLLPSILIQSNADLLVYGMGEKTILEIAKHLSEGIKIKDITSIPQTAFLANKEFIQNQWKTIDLYSFEECLSSKEKHARNFHIIETESNKIYASAFAQITKGKKIIVNPPDTTFCTQDIDHSFDLPYTRLPHPKYQKRGDIPAYEMIKFSVNIHRGCFGGCSFCTISFHQGKQVISRSEKSILQEIEKISQLPGFKGYLSDLGGPSANMFMMNGKDKNLCGKCSRYSCIHPQICGNLNADHQPLINLYQKTRTLPYIKKVTIGSGVRYDLFTDTNQGKKYFSELVKHHVSGRLKVAPEHTSENVLALMRKPSFSLFYQLKKEFDSVCRKNSLNQQLIPYFISSHPGCSLQDMLDLAMETKSLQLYLEQVQDFTPTPMTLSTEVYYTGLNPQTLEKIYIPRSEKEKQQQKRFFFWYKKENQENIKSLLYKTGQQKYIEKLFGQKRI